MEYIQQDMITAKMFKNREKTSIRKQIYQKTVNAWKWWKWNWQDTLQSL